MIPLHPAHGRTAAGQKKKTVQQPWRRNRSQLNLSQYSKLTVIFTLKMKGGNGSSALRLAIAYVLAATSKPFPQAGSGHYRHCLPPLSPFTHL
jgi:hypothetical protein